MLAWQAGAQGRQHRMLEATKLIVAVKNIEMPDERCSAPAG
jgi:hypothetical protein